jgi:hypothetical protein
MAGMGKGGKKKGGMMDDQMQKNSNTMWDRSTNKPIKKKKGK